MLNFMSFDGPYEQKRFENFAAQLILFVGAVGVDAVLRTTRKSRYEIVE